MVGAVGRLLRVERCERLQLVAAATRICIATCHDCVFYLGVNRPPLLIGDNRFLQARTLLMLAGPLYRVGVIRASAGRASTDLGVSY